MINIEEKVATKCSGLTSLYITFDFNMEIVNVLKQSPEKSFYDKNTHIWESPITSLAHLLDTLTYLDDIVLKLQTEDSEETHFYPKLVDNYKIPPFKHQLEAIEWGLNRDCGLLLDAPGLGKTATIIHLAEELKEQKGLEHCLIICGINALKGNWEAEIKKHSNLTCRIIGKKISKNGKVSYSSIKERALELRNPLDAFFYIINVECLRSSEIVQAIKNSKNKIDMITLDECQRCKSVHAAQASGLLQLIKSKHRIGLTGTLIQSKPLDAYVPLKWIGVEKATLTNFKSQYCIYGGFGGHQIVGYKNLKLLKEELDTCSLRRTKDIIEGLPPKFVMDEILEMNDDHRQFYENVKNGVREQCDKIELNGDNVLALTVRLIQASTCPSLLTSAPIKASKIERATELAEEIIENGNKVVIMSTIKEPLRILKDALKQYSPLLGSGDVDEDTFEKNKELFQTDPKYKVWLGTTQRSGTGLTLNAATYMICLDTPWTAAECQQVFDRIHRVDNKGAAFIYRLICADTIDERVAEIVNIKQAMGDYLIDDVTTESTMALLRSYIEDL